jgi:hypothetical protein
MASINDVFNQLVVVSATICQVQLDSVAETNPTRSEQLKIVGIAVRRPTPVPEAARGVQELLHLSIEIENPSNKALYVWASRRAYDYDASSHVLSIYLTEHTPDPPPDIEMISDHPRTPVQIMIEAGGRVTIDVPVPKTIRRRVPREGLGMTFVEEPIEQIERVDLQVQFAYELFHDLVQESPAEHRKRLKAHGKVARATITPTEQKEQ